MIEFGNTLRAAREAGGFTVGQLAEKTKMAPTTIHELEVEDFTRIAAPIYGRGFVKLYCEAVGIDPAPLVSEFMEIYNGNHDTVIRRRPAASAPCADGAPAGDLAAAEPPRQEPDIQATEAPSPVESEPPPEPLPEALPEPPPTSGPDLFQQSAQTSVSAAPEGSPAEPSLSRYAAPMRSPARRTTLDASACLRLGLLAAVALVLLAVAFCGIRAVYRATTPGRPELAEETPAVQPEKAPAAKAAPEKSAPTAPRQGPTGKTSRTPQKIPSLYMD